MKSLFLVWSLLPLPGQQLLLYPEQHHTGGADDVETVNGVPERDVEPGAAQLVTQAVGSAAHSLGEGV